MMQKQQTERASTSSQKKELSRQTDPITQIKRKIIGYSAGDDEYAYHIITNCTMPYIPSNSPSNKGMSNLTLKISSDIMQDHKEILTKATKEVLGQGVDLIFRNKDPYLKSNGCNANPEIKTTNSEPAISSSPLWQKIRNILKQRFGDKGEALDRSWFAKLDIDLQACAEAKEERIKIKCPNSFVRSWIKANYGSAIEDAIESAVEHATKQFAEVEYAVT